MGKSGLEKGGPKAPSAKAFAIQLIVVFGVISLFSDTIYEGARSVNGPYLKTLGANAALVGLVAGLAEMLGYLVRLLSGAWADKSKAYWTFTIVGYATLATVPLLARQGHDPLHRDQAGGHGIRLRPPRGDGPDRRHPRPPRVHDRLRPLRPPTRASPTTRRPTAGSGCP